MDFTKVWRSIRIDDDGKIIDAAKLLEELRFQLKLQLEETRRDRNRSVQHFVASILIHVNSALGMNETFVVVTFADSRIK